MKEDETVELFYNPILLIKLINLVQVTPQKNACQEDSEISF